MPRDEIINRVAIQCGLSASQVEAVFLATRAQGCCLIRKMERQQIYEAELLAATDYDPFRENEETFIFKTLLRAIAAADVFSPPTTADGDPAACAH